MGCELRERFSASGLGRASAAGDGGGPWLLMLSADAFEGAVGERLAAEVEAALVAGVRLVMAYDPEADAFGAIMDASIRYALAEGDEWPGSRTSKIHLHHVIGAIREDESLADALTACSPKPGLQSMIVAHASLPPADCRTSSGPHEAAMVLPTDVFEAAAEGLGRLAGRRAAGVAV